MQPPNFTLCCSESWLWVLLCTVILLSRSSWPRAYSSLLSFPNCWPHLFSSWLFKLLLTCPAQEARGEKVKSSTATKASDSALVECKQLPNQERQQASGPHIFCEHPHSLTNQSLSSFHAQCLTRVVTVLWMNPWTRPVQRTCFKIFFIRKEKYGITFGKCMAEWITIRRTPLVTTNQLKKNFATHCRSPSVCGISITTSSLSPRVSTILTWIEISSLHFLCFCHSKWASPRHYNLV